MTYFWADTCPVRVASHSDLPVSFTWRGRRHTVRQIANRWRVEQGWWDRYIRRDYFKLLTDTGLLVIIYHDLAGGGWYLYRLYD